MQGDVTQCGADSFMIRDSVCDEKSNIAKCLYDGGDCCLENKDRTLCRKCICFMDVDHDELKGQFLELEIKPVEDPDNVNVNWTIEVEEVDSAQVCAALCLEHDNADTLNSWHYKEWICKCGWVESTSCPERMIVQNWTMDSLDQLGEWTAFVQLHKTVPCGKF